MSDLLSLSETARRHNVSKSGLWAAVKDDRPIKGMPLNRYVAREEDGEFLGFDFPEDYSFPDEGEGPEEELSGHGASAGLQRVEIESKFIPWIMRLVVQFCDMPLPFLQAVGLCVVDEELPSRNAHMTSEEPENFFVSRSELRELEMVTTRVGYSVVIGLLEVLRAQYPQRWKEEARQIGNVLDIDLNDESE